MSNATDLRNAKREATTTNQRAMYGQYVEIQDNSGRRLSIRRFGANRWGAWVDGE